MGEEGGGLTKARSTLALGSMQRGTLGFIRVNYLFVPLSAVVQA